MRTDDANGASDDAIQPTTEPAVTGSRRAARAARRGDGQRPRRPGSPGVPSPSSDPSPSSLATQPEAAEDGEATETPQSGIQLLDLKGRGGARTAARARKKQDAAAAAVDNAEDNPALGALNRHLNMMMQQLTAAHRVIGRVAAERDALRQQLADLQGIPVEQIEVTTIGVASELATSSRGPSAASPGAQHPSRLARFNIFGGDDFELMRKRRQMFVLVLAVVGVILALFAQQMRWSMPEDISRESLSALPMIGNLMTVFLAGWVLFRILRVTGKGVRWVFPSEQRGRRRR